MNTLPRLLVATSASAAVWLLSSANALAAPPPSCAPSTITPAASSVPANLPGFAYGTAAAASGDIHLFALGPMNTKTEVPLTLGPVVGTLTRVAPAQPFIADTTYELDYSPQCNLPVYPASESLRFTAAPAAALPTTLGAFEGAPTARVDTAGSVSIGFEATFVLAPEMLPWASVYTFSLVVDDAELTTNLVRGSGGPTVVLGAKGYCAAQLGGSGTHSVHVHGTLPFAPDLSSVSASVTYACPASPSPGGGDEAIAPQPKSGGCSVSQGRASSASYASCASSLALAGIVAGALALVRRRRSRASRPRKRRGRAAAC